MKEEVFMKQGFIFLWIFLLSGFAQANQNDNLWKFAGWYGGGMYPQIITSPKQEDVVYLTSDVAGIWRSDNKGDQWSFINEGLTNLNVAVFAVAPSNENVLYAGGPDGIFRSDNGGSSWSFLNQTKKFKIKFKKPQSYRSIYIDPNDSDKIWAGTQHGEVFFSNNGGKKWKRLGRLPFGKAVVITAVVVDSDRATVFAGSEFGLVRWNAKNTQWEQALVAPMNTAIRDLVIAGDGDTPIFYAAGSKHVLSSSDHGQTWQQSAEIPKGEILRLAVKDHSDNQQTLLVAWLKSWDGGVFLSTNKGKTWKNIEKGLQHDQQGNPTRSWMRGFSKPNGLAIDPFNPKVFYFTDSWGVWRSDDQGQSWVEKIVGAPNTVGSDISIAENGDIYVATMDDGLLKSTDEGQNYKALFPSQGYSDDRNGHVWRVLLPDQQTVLATSSPWGKNVNQVVRSEDAGKSFSINREGLPQKRPKINAMWGQSYPRGMAIDPSNHNRIYMGMDGDDGGGLFISDDQGKTWQKSSGQPGSVRIFNGLAVDPEDPNRLFWGACGEGGGVYVSSNQGQSWKHVLKKMSCVFDVVATPGGRIYAAGTDNGAALYVSDDHGKTWQLKKRFNDASACLAVTVVGKHVFVGTVLWNLRAPGHIFMSLDDGVSWENVTANLPVSSGPAALAIHPISKNLYVLLHAGSVYQRSFSQILQE